MMKEWVKGVVQKKVEALLKFVEGEEGETVAMGGGKIEI